jgi:hypothetical protein
MRGVYDLVVAVVVVVGEEQDSPPFLQSVAVTSANTSHWLKADVAP